MIGRRFLPLGDPEARKLWRDMSGAGKTFDLSLLQTPEAREVLQDVANDTPEASEALDALRRFEAETAGEVDPFKDARRFAWFVPSAWYLGPPLILAGVGAAATGALVVAH